MHLQAGELGLLKAIRERFARPSRDLGRGVITGIGDDAAVIAPPGEPFLVTTDLMHEGVHFDLAYTAYYHLGFKLVSVNVSDIMAMGGIPRYLFLNMSLRRDSGDEMFPEFLDGVSLACQEYDLVLAGGDLSAARDDIVVSATVIGTAERAILRNGAVPGDLIYVTGPLGDSACGLEILKRLSPESRQLVKSQRFSTGPAPANVKAEFRTDGLHFRSDLSVPDLDWQSASPLLRRHLMPIARRSDALNGLATAMIDVSDGLFIDLWRLCDESGVGARVFLDRVPISRESRTASRHLGLDCLSLAVSGGEDYELLFTAPAESLIGARTDECPVTCIGEITGGERVAVDGKGKETPLMPRGFEHFASP